jgi:hypothetical protein
MRFSTVKSSTDFFHEHLMGIFKYVSNMVPIYGDRVVSMTLVVCFLQMKCCELRAKYIAERAKLELSLLISAF